MKHYTLKELIILWEQERITPEQAIGQILLILTSHHQRLLKVEATRKNNTTS
jgi:hypothetical protein